MFDSVEALLPKHHSVVGLQPLLPASLNFGDGQRRVGENSPGIQRLGPETRYLVVLDVKVDGVFFADTLKVLVDRFLSVDCQLGQAWN